MSELNKSKFLKFEKKNLGEMKMGEFIKYYNDEWFPFMKEVAEYGKALDTLAKMIRLREHAEK